MIIIIFAIISVQPVIAAGTNTAEVNDFIVHTKLGPVRGMQGADGDYSMYLGIPYAKVNRSNPFGNSLPVENFADVFDASTLGDCCPQVKEYSTELAGSLDCLNINIFVPNVYKNDYKLPVLVNIYGGAFIFGRSIAEAKHIMEKNIILVSFDYRSGPYGFMCLGTPDVPGNQGLKDQLLALRWIKDNISAFGGDDRSITLYGVSSGGVSVDLHLLYNKERLFNKVIIGSGVAISYWGVKEINDTTPLIIARQLGYKTHSTADAMIFLTQQHELAVTQASFDAGVIYRPCIERRIEGVESYITEYPVNVKPYLKDFRIMIGYTEDEYVYHINYIRKMITNAEINKMITNKLMSVFQLPSIVEDETKIIRMFFSGDDQNNIIRNVIDIGSDFFVCHPTERATQTYVDRGARVYRYLFAYVGDINYTQCKRNESYSKATHADEIAYTLHSYIKSFDLSPEDQHMCDVMTTLISNFVKHGDPTPSPTELLPVKWLPVTNDTLHYLRIDSTLSMGTRPFNRRMAFWDLLYMMNKKYLKGLTEIERL